jgi:hypothetical protein
MPTVTLDLPPEVEHQLRTEAAAAGMDLASYVRAVLTVKRDLVALKQAIELLDRTSLRAALEDPGFLRRLESILAGVEGAHSIVPRNGERLTLQSEAPDADHAQRAVSPATPRPNWRARLDALVEEFRAGLAESGAAGEDVSPEALEDAISEAREERRQERLSARVGRH